MLAFTFAYFYQIPSTIGNSRLALTMSIVKQGRLNTDTFNSTIRRVLTVWIGQYTKEKSILTKHRIVRAGRCGLLSHLHGPALLRERIERNEGTTSPDISCHGTALGCYRNPHFHPV